MSDDSQGSGWWLASDGQWYPPHLHPDAQAAPAQSAPEPAAPVQPADPEPPENEFVQPSPPVGSASPADSQSSGSIFGQGPPTGHRKESIFGDRTELSFEPPPTRANPNLSTSNPSPPVPTMRSKPSTVSLLIIGGLMLVALLVGMAAGAILFSGDDEPLVKGTSVTASTVDTAISDCETELAAMRTAVAAAEASNQADPDAGETPLAYLKSIFDFRFWEFGEDFSIFPVNGQSGDCGDFDPTSLTPDERRAECESQLYAYKTAIGEAIVSNTKNGNAESTPEDFMESEGFETQYWTVDKDWTVVPVNGASEPC